jgi:DNA-binding NarL/FixJ family response regulator
LGLDRDSQNSPQPLSPWQVPCYRIGSGVVLNALGHIKLNKPDLFVLMFSAVDNPTYMARAAAMGASGYLLKGCSRDDLIHAIEAAAAGETLWTRNALRQISGAMSTPRLAGDSEVPLTQREGQVLRELVNGSTNKDIATALGISYETVKEHVQQIFGKIGVTDRTQAAVWAVIHGGFDLDGGKDILELGRRKTFRPDVDGIASAVNVQSYGKGLFSWTKLARLSAFGGELHFVRIGRTLCEARRFDVADDAGEKDTERPLILGRKQVQVHIGLANRQPLGKRAGHGKRGVGKGHVVAHGNAPPHSNRRRNAACPARQTSFKRLPPSLAHERTWIEGMSARPELIEKLPPVGLAGTADGDEAPISHVLLGGLAGRAERTGGGNQSGIAPASTVDDQRILGP